MKIPVYTFQRPRKKKPVHENFTPTEVIFDQPQPTGDSWSKWVVFLLILILILILGLMGYVYKFGVPVKLKI